jgi:multiple sugar transport system substrate-binding protein
VSFQYRTLRFEEYQQELLKAFAAGEGPDVFSLHNTWMGEYKNLITPLPDSLTIPYTEVRGTIKKETVTVLREEPTLTQRTLKKDYVDVVAGDVILPYQPNPKQPPEDRIYGLPLSIDTLALFYNKDLLNAASIAEPPANWTQFQDDVVKLSSIGANDEILQSGAAIGTSANVERAFDIVSLLMMQNGTVMTDDRGKAVFGQPNDARQIPGADAVRFYTDFGNPLKEVYTWNASQPDSFDAFATGKTAFFFGYSYHTPLIRARAEKLNFGIAPVPQIEGGRTVNYANYWVETVAKSTKNVDWAWDFIQFAARQDQVTSYLDAAKKPPALRVLIDSQLEDEDLSVFASQLLLSESWYKGDDAAVAEDAFAQLIDDILAGVDSEEAIAQAQNKVNQTL